MAHEKQYPSSQNGELTVANFNTAKADRSGARNTYDPSLNGRYIFGV